MLLVCSVTSFYTFKCSNHHLFDISSFVKSGAAMGISSKPLQTLSGHDAEVTCAAINSELDMAVSASKVRQNYTNRQFICLVSYEHVQEETLEIVRSFHAEGG